MTLISSRQVDYLDLCNIRKGSRVMEYGSGLGLHLSRASALVGPAGAVYAADIRKGSMLFVKLLIRTQRLDNVIPLHIKPYKIELPDKELDLIFSPGAFHQVTFPNLWLKELHRLLNPAGFLILGKGHQKEKQVKEKIYDTGIWEIVTETRQFVRCLPL